MKTRLYAALMAVSALNGCAGTQPPPSAPSASEAALIAAEIAALPSQDRLEVGAAVATEVGARFRCPRDAGETTLLIAARALFDRLARPNILPESAAVVDRLRVATNEACGIG